MANTRIITGPFLDSMRQPANGVLVVASTTPTAQDDAWAFVNPYIVQIANGQAFLQDGITPWALPVTQEGQAFRIIQRIQPSGSTDATQIRVTDSQRVVSVPAGTDPIPYAQLPDAFPALEDGDYVVPAYAADLIAKWNETKAAALEATSARDQIVELSFDFIPKTTVEIYITPSGDTSGVTDLAAINTALASGQTDGVAVKCIFRGRYFINGRIRMYSNTSLWGAGYLENSITMAAGSSSSTNNMIENVEQSVGGAGNFNLSIEGIWLNGQGGLQPVSGSRVGLYFVHVDTLRVNNVRIGPMGRMAAMHYACTNVKYSNIDLNQDRSRTNQDGIDFGPGCNTVDVNGVTGITSDDCFSIFAKNTGGNVTAYTQSLTAAQRSVYDIRISNVTVDVAISPVRLQAGDGSTLKRVRVSNFTNTRTTSADINGNDVGILCFGNTSYITDAPAAADMTEIVLDGYTGPGVWLIDAQSNFSRVRAKNITLITSGDTGSQTWKALLGSGGVVAGFVPTFYDVAISAVESAKPTYAGSIIDLPAGTVGSGVSVSNVHASALGGILAGGAGLTDVTLFGIHMALATGVLFRATGTYTGLADDISVGGRAAGITTTYAGAALGMKMGHAMPPLVAADVTPTAILGSIFSSNGTKNPTADSSTDPGMFAGSGTSWNRLGILTPDTTPPTTPGAPLATAGAFSNQLAWSGSTDNVAVTGYRIYRSDNPTTILDTTTALTYTDTTPTTGTSYTYRVRAIDGAGNQSPLSAASNTVTSSGVLTAISDTFTRSNASTPGGTWAAGPGTALARFPIVSNQLKFAPSGSASSYLFNGVTCGSAKQFAQMDVTGQATSTTVPDPHLIIRAEGAGATLTGYVLRHLRSPAAWQLYRFENGVGVLVGSYTDTAQAAPYTVRTEADGPVIKLVAGPIGGPLTVKGSFNDPNPLTYGRTIGIGMRSNGDNTGDALQTVDNFLGGDLT